MTTEDTGWTDQPAPYNMPVVPAVPEPESPAEPAPVAEDPAPAEPASEPPAAVEPPWVPDGQPGWLVDAIHGLHERLTALGG